MADISNIVDVQILRQTTSVTRAGFGTGLILGPNATFAERVREYADEDEVLEDFLATDDEYKAALAYFSQEIKPELVKIGRRATPVAEVTTIDFDIDFVTGNNIDATIQDVAITTVPFITDQGTTIANLAAAIQASLLVSTAVVSGPNQITVTAQIAGVGVNVDNVITTGGATQPVATVLITTPNVGVIEDLTAVSNEDDDWYGLILTDRNQEVVKLASAYIEAKRKIFGTASSDVNILDDTVSTDVASELQALNRDRSFVFFNESPDSFPEAAWMGRVLPTEVGSATWKFMELSGVVASNLSTSQRNAALGKGANLYTEIGGVDITEEGTMAGGEFIDVIRGVDWIQARMEETIYALLVNSDKVPFTDGGIALVENEMRGVLEQAESRSIIADDPKYVVTVPRALDVPLADRAIRCLPDMKFEARLAGAIHKVKIRGFVTV